MLDVGALRNRGAALVAAAAACLLLAACGDDDSTTETEADASATTTETSSAETVEVTATEYEFDLSANPTAETTSIEFVNDGKEPHAVVFAKLNEGFTVAEAVELEGEKGSAVEIGTTGAGPGKSATLAVKKSIEPGDYVLLCPISGPEGAHYELGQLEEFAIE